MGVRKELDLIKKEFREGIHMPWYSHYFDFKKFSVLILRAEVVLKKIKNALQAGIDDVEDEKDDLQLIYAEFMQVASRERDIVENFFLETLQMCRLKYSEVALRAAALAKQKGSGRCDTSLFVTQTAGLANLHSLKTLKASPYIQYDAERERKEKERRKKEEREICIEMEVFENEGEREEKVKKKKMKKVIKKRKKKKIGEGEEEGEEGERERGEREGERGEREGREGREREEEVISKVVLQKLKENTLEEIRLIYSDMNNLQGYQKLNYTTITKLLNLFDMMAGTSCQEVVWLDQTAFSNTNLKALMINMNADYRSLKSISFDDEDPYPFLFESRDEEEDLETLCNAKVQSELTQKRRERETHKKKILVSIVSAIVFFTILGFSFFLPPEDRRAGRAAALLSFVTIFWVFEPIPFFVTALWIPLITVLLFVLGYEIEETDTSHSLSSSSSSSSLSSTLSSLSSSLSSSLFSFSSSSSLSSLSLSYYGRSPSSSSSSCDLSEDARPMALLSAAQASTIVYKLFFDSSVALVLGGFSISVAFQKCDFQSLIGGIMQEKLGHRPKLFLVAFLFSGFFLSAWISNVAASLLIGGIFLPVIRTFPRNSRYVRSMVLGLAFACNFGGMLTPVASPGNAVVYGYMSEHMPASKISFLEWMVIAVPFASVCFAAELVFILSYIKPDDVHRIPSMGPYSLEMDFKRKFVLIVTGMTIFLWMSLPWTGGLIGNTGNVGFLPLALFLSVGILTKEDFEKKFGWNLIFLLGGGHVLGFAVDNSGLLKIVVDQTQPFLADLAPWEATIAVTIFVALITTFISHAVAAIILTPVIAYIGCSLEIPKLLVMASILMNNGSQTLPMTSFPNVNAILMEDRKGEPYVKVKHFLQYGGSMTLTSAILTITWGYVIMLFIWG